MAEATRTVLLVEGDATVRNRLGRWLEDAGHEVLVCPGPTGPDYTCVGARGRSCPLARAAEVVVLDAALPGDALLTGTSLWDLLYLYLGQRKPVVLLIDGEPPLLAASEPDVRVVRKPPERRALMAAVRTSFESSPRPDGLAQS